MLSGGVDEKGQEHPPPTTNRMKIRGFIYTGGEEIWPVDLCWSRTWDVARVSVDRSMATLGRDGLSRDWVPKWMDRTAGVVLFTWFWISDLES